MRSKLAEMLHLDLEPVGIYFGNAEAACDTTAEPGKRNCVVPFLLAAARGKVVGITEEGCTCPGGTVGLCFGDGFTRKNPNIHKMLSQGMGDAAPEQAPPMMREGERFFCDEEAVLRWRNAMPFSDVGFPRVVFAPEGRWGEVGEPDLASQPPCRSGFPSLQSAACQTFSSTISAFLCTGGCPRAEALFLTE